MNPHVKEIWTAALDSGEFAQGKQRLRGAGDDYCCLGVLCEVYKRDTGQGEWIARSGCYEFYAPGGAEAALIPPKPVMEWAGLEGQGLDDLVIDDDNFPIPVHNDGSGGTKPKTFQQISNAIKEQL